MKIKLLFIFFITICACGFAQPVNDDPCFAIPLPVTATCNQTTSTNNGATASAGVPAPGCGTYSGGDVWFSAVVPASGSFTVTTYGTAFNNLAVATYTGNACSSLTLISCTYNGAGNVNMPIIPITGTPGVVYYFRAWNPGNTTVGNFDICATSPSPTPLVPNNQDCLDAIPICQSSFTNTTSYSGTGNVGNEINTGISCLLSGEKNDVWYQFTVQNSGNLCFAIDPITNTDDYDWGLFNLSTATCPDIASNAALAAACNYSGATAWSGGGTAPSWVLSGATNGCTGLFPTAPDNTESQCGPCIAVTTGQSFVLNISNFTSSNSGYHLFFPPPGTPGMAIIYDNVPPVMQALSVTPGCGANQMFVDFSENIQCSSIQNADFSISGPGGPYTISNIVSTYCSAGGTYDKQLLINFTPALTTTGTYTICLTNASGSVLDACNNPAAPTCFTFNIAGPSITATPTNPNCNPNTGTVVAVGGTTAGPFTYQMDGGTSQASGTFTGVTAGTHTFLTTNAAGCSASTTANITIPTAISATLTPTNASCAGNDGSIATAVSGGIPGYTYAWSPSGTGANPSGLTPATYTVTITDTKSCTYTASTPITSAGAATANFTPPATQCLTGNNFSFTNTGTGGATYAWDFGDSNIGAGSPVTHSYATAGSFVVTETVTLGGCTATKTGTITVSPMPTVTVNNPSICPGSTATLTANGATTYNWSAGTTPTTGSVVTVSPGGTTSYTVTGTTATCTNSAVATVSIASTLTISVTGGAICKGQTTLTLTANSNASTFSWSPGTGLSGTTGNPVVANPTTTQVYTVVGSSGTCTTSTTATVTVNNPPTLTPISSTICAGQQTGSLSVSGASTYTWTGGGITGNTTSNPTDNPAGTTVYNVNATDVNTCTATATATITVNTPSTLTVTSASICNGAGPATLGVSGASTYTWSGGGITGSHSTAPIDNPAVTTIYTVNGTDVHTCTATATGTITIMGTPTISVTGGSICKGQTTLVLTANSNASTFAWSPATGLSATTGNSVTANPTTTQSYTIVGTAGTCTTSTTATVTVNNPPVLATTSSTICIGQQTGTVTVNGASTYTWSGGSITGNTTTNPTDNPTSTTPYTVNATDVNTCTATATATIIVNPLPIVTVNSATICLGQQTATLTAAGASTYSWPAGLSSTTGATVTGSPAVTTPYTVTGTDVNGCTNTAVATINVISNPTLTVAGGAMCVGQQTVVLTANSNASTFTWSPAAGLSATTGSSVTANPTTVGPNIYTIIGAAGSCTVSTTATVTVYALPAPTASTNIPCETENALNLTSTPAGTYTYSWSGPNSFTSTAQNPSITIFNNVTQAVAGPYTVTVTDPNSCYNTATVTVVVNPKPTITATGATVCVGQTINLTSTGAGATGNYSWSGQGGAYTSGQQNPSITNAVTGMTSIYNVVGTDANGCYNGAAVQVQVNALPVITATSGTICVGQQTATLIASSTNAGTNYSWTPATGLSATTGSTVIANPSPAGTYTYLVTGTDANTCVGTFSTSVLVNPLPVITVTSGTICIGQQTATLMASSTNAGTTYSWLPATGLSSTTNTVVMGTPSVSTNYVITGTDGNGCVSTGNSSILVNTLPTITATSGTICIGQTTNLTASSTNAGTTYSWTPAAGLVSTTGATVAANPTPAGTYSYVVTGTDGNGCFSSGSSQVIVYALPVVTVTSGTICLGQQTATLTASNALTYTWSPSNTLSASTGPSVYGFPANVGENDYTVTATDIHTCVNTATTSIWVNALPTVVTVSVAPECVPFCTTLTATPSPAGTYNYSWTLGNGQTSQAANPVACYSVASIYAVKLLLTDANGCTTTTSMPVNALSVPVADFEYGQQPVSILAPEVQFTNESTYGLPNHSWNFGDPYSTGSHDTSSVNNPTHTYAEVGTYNVTLTVSTANGCSASVVKPIIINEDYVLYVPNAFSPNADGKNEIFKAVGEGIKDYKLYIYDRWGLLLFFSDDINKGWDGKLQGGSDIVQEDTYVWKIQAVDFKNKAKNLNGTVTLLR